MDLLFIGKEEEEKKREIFCTFFRVPVTNDFFCQQENLSGWQPTMMECSAESRNGYSLSFPPRPITACCPVCMRATTRSLAVVNVQQLGLHANACSMRG